MNARPSLSGARWGLRPADQRFDTVSTLYDALSQRQARARSCALRPEALRVLPADDGLLLEHEGEPMVPSAYAAGQISRALGLPAQAIRVLSPELGAAALNERIERTRHGLDGLRRGTTLLLEDSPDGLTRLRGLQSQAYSRTWDRDVVDALIQPLLDAGYVPAAASAQQPDTDRALFSSDRDLFCFLVRDDPQGSLHGLHGRPLRRGVVLRNSEVGGLSLHLRAFWFDRFCTNHMVFGGRMAAALTEPHRVGDRPPLQRLLDRWHAAGGLAAFDQGRSQAEAMMRRAAEVVVARWDQHPRELEAEAVESMVRLARRARVRTLLPRRLLRAGAQRARVYATARGASDTATHEGADVAVPPPGLTLWHLACGLTEVSQERSGHTDARARIDAAVGRVLAAA